MTTKNNIRSEALDWIERRLKAGDSLDLAAGRAAARIVRQGQAEAFVEEFGQGTLCDCWREHNRSVRRIAEGNGAAASPGTPRVNSTILKEPEAILETWVSVGHNEFLLLGDCTGEMCGHAAKFHRSQAEGNLRKAHMFTRLAEGLRGNQNVRSKFTNEQVQGFLREFQTE